MKSCDVPLPLLIKTQLAVTFCTYAVWSFSFHFNFISGLFHFIALLFFYETPFEDVTPFFDKLVFVRLVRAKKC